jgi:EAL and modified HD-GYP domain-containing signal transduction protein
VQEIALWRARFLEGLAQRRAEPIETVSALFTAGLLSLMDVLLQIPLQQALQPLRLSEAALQALLERRGPWAPYFQLMSDVEKNDLGAIAKSASEFGEMEQLTELSDAAWEWAAKATATATATATCRPDEGLAAIHLTKRGIRACSESPR